MNSIQATSHERVKLQSSNFCMFLALSPITWLLGSDRLPHFSALHCPSHCCRAAIPGQWLQRKAQRLFGRDPFEQANWASPRTLSSLSFLLLAIVQSVFSRSHHISTFLHFVEDEDAEGELAQPECAGLAAVQGRHPHFFLRAWVFGVVNLYGTFLMRRSCFLAYLKITISLRWAWNKCC